MGFIVAQFTKRNTLLISYAQVITLLNSEKNLFMKKCFFQTYTAIFHFFEKLFYYYEFKLRNIYKNTCASFYISMMKPEAATGGVL